MSYDPLLHHRRSIRLKGYDYAQPGVYYITICTHRRECLFGDVILGEMHLSPLGEVVARRWQTIPKDFPNVELDEWVVMPNHVHGILRIVDRKPVPVDGGDTASAVVAPADGARRPRGAAPGSVGAIVGNFKSVATRRINRIRRSPRARVWQRGYWEHIVRGRGGEDLDRIREYIRANPERWERERNSPGRRGEDKSDRWLGFRLRYVREQ